jgi:hypothetical protein
MKTKEHQNGEIEEHNLPKDVPNQTKSVDESRRLFTKSSLVVSGVLLTLASRSALGGGGTVVGGVCKSPSGFLSGNASQHGTPCTCSGRTPGYWGTNTDTSHTWPTPYKTGSCTNTKFTQQYTSWSNTGTTSGTLHRDTTLGFHCTGYAAGYYKYSMIQVILLGGKGDPSQLGAHCVASLLNIRKGWIPASVLTEAQVRNMFNEYAAKGYFEPTAGVKWYPADIVTYLKSTMPL